MIVRIHIIYTIYCLHYMIWSYIYIHICSVHYMILYTQCIHRCTVYTLCYIIYIIIINNVLLVKIEGPVRYTIYHHLPVVKGVNKPSINQPTNGKRTSMIIIFIFKNYPNELHLIRPHWEMRGSRVERMCSNRFETWMAYLTPRHWAITKTYWFFDREWGNDPYYLHCTWWMVYENFLVGEWYNYPIPPFPTKHQ